jgi:hypothetical protein
MTGSPADNPAFLDKERAESLAYPGAANDAAPTFDTELTPDDPETPTKGVISRYREVARLHALGKTNNSIAAILGYTASRVSIILRDPFVQAEIARYRAAFFDQTTIDQMKQASHDGVRLVHSVILDDKEKTEHRLKAATLAFEATHGKARQQLNIESNTLGTFMELIRDMNSRGETLDVTPGPAKREQQQSAAAELPEARSAEGAGRWSNWIGENL